MASMRLISGEQADITLATSILKSALIEDTYTYELLSSKAIAWEDMLKAFLQFTIIAMLKSGKYFRHLCIEEGSNEPSGVMLAFKEPEEHALTSVKDFLAFLMMPSGSDLGVFKTLQAFRGVDARYQKQYSKAVQREHDAVSAQYGGHVVYMNWFGVQKEKQNRGLGGKFLEAFHKQVAALEAEEGQGPYVIYLEATSARCKRFFERHGYESICEINPPGGGPPLFPMIRRPVPTIPRSPFANGPYPPTADLLGFSTPLPPHPPHHQYEPTPGQHETLHYTPPSETANSSPPSSQLPNISETTRHDASDTTNNNNNTITITSAPMRSISRCSFESFTTARSEATRSIASSLDYSASAHTSPPLPAPPPIINAHAMHTSTSFRDSRTPSPATATTTTIATAVQNSNAYASDPVSLNQGQQYVPQMGGGVQGGGAWKGWNPEELYEQVVQLNCFCCSFTKIWRSDAALMRSKYAPLQEDGMPNSAPNPTTPMTMSRTNNNPSILASPVSNRTRLLTPLQQPADNLRALSMDGSRMVTKNPRFV